jgi:hypothetical protein
LRDSLRFRLQTEFSMLEQTAAQTGIEPPIFYTSFRVPQGYTQRGEVIGAATGPGSSSQWAAVDLMDRMASLGLVLGRIRWEEEAYFFSPVGSKRFTHDVSLIKGVRGSLRYRDVSLNAEFLKTKRLNMYFQSVVFGDYWHSGFDAYNYTLNVGAAYSR